MEFEFVYKINPFYPFQSVYGFDRGRLPVHQQGGVRRVVLRQVLVFQEHTAGQV